MTTVHPTTEPAPEPPARRRGITPQRYRALTWLALLLVGTIIVTGASVRLSGSGLGCEDWPNCSSEDFIAIENPNQAIEQINRLFTGLVSLGVALAVLGAHRRRPYRKDLTLLAWCLVGGVMIQAVIGGITVLVELDWQSVAAHFLASLVLLAAAVVLHHRAGEAPGPYRQVTSDRVRTLARVVLVLLSWVAVAGTLVTAAGPHGGDEKASRLGWEIPTAARLHGISVVVLLATILLLVQWMRRDGAPARALHTTEMVLGVGALQGAIGYVQYFNNIPALLVGFHVAFAAILFALTVELQMTLRVPESDAPVEDHQAPEATAAAER